MEIYSAKELYVRCAEKYLLAKKQFCSKEDFLESFQFADQQFVINLLNITLVNENRIRSEELWKIIHENDDAPLPYKELTKDFIEFRCINYFLVIFPNISFMKSEKPDFIIKMNNKIIGLEIVSAGSDIEIQINKVASLNFGRNRKPREIKKYIEENHQNMRGKYLFYDFDGVVALSPHNPCAKSEDLIDRIIGQICKKKKKSKNYNVYTELWLLIDTEGHVCFTEQHDADDLAKALNMIENHLYVFTKIIIISRLHKVHMIYDVENHEYYFCKQKHRGLRDE